MVVFFASAGSLNTSVGMLTLVVFADGAIYGENTFVLLDSR
ncbi:hypothetical protein AAH091_00840 [Candidatus Bacteroides intestinigallinarum]|nr:MULTISPECIES: hypothetical protein [Bacteroides]